MRSIRIVLTCHNCLEATYLSLGDTTWGAEGYAPHFKIYGDLLCIGPPPHFFHNIYFDWLIPHTYTIVPMPLADNVVYIYVYILEGDKKINDMKIIKVN